MSVSFDSLGLHKQILRALKEKGYETPSPIQEKAIPPVLKGHDVMASAQTGTGKTAGFTLPLIEKLIDMDGQGKRKIRVLILTPTRELAAQIQENIMDYAKYTRVKSCVIFGGVGQNPQVRKLESGVDILVATPGRLLDLESQGKLSLSHARHMVLDEADRMLDMGFARDINRIMYLLPRQRQNLLFSATFSKEIQKLASSILRNPIKVNTAPENTAAETVAQKIIAVDKGNKAKLITKMIQDGEWSQVLIFTRTKHGANRLSKQLDRSKISSSAIHGMKSQGARTRALKGFKDGSVRVLVATDIAARGLDIPLLPYVVNFDLPNVPEDYVHRIGRTGRAGADGQAYSLVDIDEMVYLTAIEKLIGRKFEREEIQGFEPVNEATGIAPGSAQARQLARKNRNQGPRRPKGANSSRRKNNSSNRKRGPKKPRRS